MVKYTKICPKCQTENPIEANFCRHCRHEFSEASKGGKSIAPVISAFDIREKKYCEGSTVHLYWHVENATKVSLDETEVTGIEECEYEVGKARSIKLVAENEYTRTKKELRLYPESAARIVEFRSSNDTIQSGQKITLRWTIHNAETVVLSSNGVDLDVTNQKDVVLNPDSTTSYTLKAYSVDESITVEKSITVNVLREVEIEYFKADKERIAETMPVILSWKVNNAEHIDLLPMYQDVTGRNEITLYPKSNTEYKIVASNRISQKEAYVYIGVHSLPKIDVKFADSLGSITMPDLSIDLSSTLGSIEETAIDRWMVAPSEQPVSKRIWNKRIFKKLKSVIDKRLS